jgi:hypothetical protein
MGKITCFESGIGGFYLCTPASGHKGNFVNCVCSSQRKMQALENTTELPSLDLSVRARLMRQRLLVKRRYFTYFLSLSAAVFSLAIGCMAVVDLYMLKIVYI